MLFLSRTKLSFIGESWHTIAQLQSSDVVPVLEATSLMRDEEVESLLKRRGGREKMVLCSEDGAGPQVVRRDKWI